MKKLRGVHLSRNRQGFIRYACLTYDERECGGPYSAALREVMCGEDSITSIALRHYVSESTLYRLRKDFYESWDKK